MAQVLSNLTPNQNKHSGVFYALKDAGIINEHGRISYLPRYVVCNYAQCNYKVMYDQYMLKTGSPERYHFCPQHETFATGQEYIPQY